MNISFLSGLNFLRFRSLRYRHLLLGLIALLTTLSLSFNPFTASFAQYKPAATSTTNPWQYASFPVENFQAYTSPYGYRIHPVTGKRQFHRGLDIAAPLGSHIRNWWTGTIVGLSDHTACGTMIQIQSGEWTHIYCHLMGYVEENGNQTYLIDQNGGILLQKGQTIPAGARIGRVGMTGRTTGPHLHWGLKHRGQYVDPALVLQEMYEKQASL
ncbi:MAG: M23 family metallopeptidase [Microcystaceae cyanobacterium]